MKRFPNKYQFQVGNGVEFDKNHALINTIYIDTDTNMAIVIEDAHSPYHLLQWAPLWLDLPHHNLWS